MVLSQSYTAALVAVASLHTATAAEIDMTHVASLEEYLSGEVHAQNMAAKTVSLNSIDSPRVPSKLGTADIAYHLGILEL
jgi:hypothetical protein